MTYEKKDCLMISEIATLKEKAKITDNRLDDLEEVTKAIYVQSVEIAKLNSNLEALIKNMNSLYKDVEFLKLEPGDKFKELKIGITIGVIVGIILRLTQYL